MSEDNSVDKPQDNKRRPAHELLIEFLKEKDIDFFIRKQVIRYMEDNGMVIEPPKIIIYYKDEIPAQNKPTEATPQPNNETATLDLPKEK